MDWKSWRAHFEAQADRPLPAVEAPPLPADVAARLAHTLGVFCLGESGEGRVAHEIDRARLPGIDDDYRAALKRFVREEGRHARILATLVGALGGRLPRRSALQRAFVRLRRLLDVRFKLLVLLAAEIVGIATYGALAAALPPGPFRDALTQIVADERYHLVFHVDFFRTQVTNARDRAAFRAAWWPVAAAASIAVAAHHRTFRALGARGVAAHVARLVREVDAALAVRAALSPGPLFPRAPGR